MIYYLQAISDNISVEIDSDIDYYEHFKAGDIIHIELDIKKTLIQIKGIDREGNFNSKLINNPRFVICEIQSRGDWETTDIKKVTINEAIELGHLSDITKMVERNKKIENLGI